MLPLSLSLKQIHEYVQQLNIHELAPSISIAVQAAISTPLGPPQHPQPAPAPGDSMILVAVLLCTLLRGVRMQESKIAAVGLLTQAAMHCDDDTRLQRVVPYLLVTPPLPPVSHNRK